MYQCKIPMQKYFTKNKFYKEIVFIKQWKLKHILKTRQIKPKTEEDIFEKSTGKTWIPPNNHHTIETFIQAANNVVNVEIAHINHQNI